MEKEREFIKPFKGMILEDHPINQKQEQRLLAAIYNENQSVKERQNEKKGSLSGPNQFDIKWLKEELEAQKRLHNRYIESARNILTEPQLQRFKKFLDAQMSMYEISVSQAISQMSDSERE